MEKNKVSLKNGLGNFNGNLYEKTILNVNTLEKENIKTGTAMTRILSGNMCIGKHEKRIEIKKGDEVHLSRFGTERNDKGWVYLKEMDDIGFNGEWSSEGFDIKTDLRIEETKNIILNKQELDKNYYTLVDSKDNIIHNIEVNKRNAYLRTEKDEAIEQLKFYLREIVKKEIYKEYKIPNHLKEKELEALKNIFEKRDNFLKGETIKKEEKRDMIESEKKTETKKKKSFFNRLLG